MIWLLPFLWLAPAAVIYWNARDQAAGIRYGVPTGLPEEPPELSVIANTDKSESIPYASTLFYYFRLGIYMQEMHTSYVPPRVWSVAL